MRKRFDLNGVINAAMLRLEGRVDANETAMFTRQLEHVFSKVYEIKKLESVWRTFISVNTEVSNADEAHTFREIDGFGEAEIVDGYFAKDFPSTELQGKEFSGVVKSLGASYAYTVQDMRRAAQTGLDLSARKAEIARQVIERKLDDLAFLGDSKYGFTGLKGLSGITDLTGGITGGWATATAPQIKDDVTVLAEKIFEDTKGTCAGKVLLLGTKAYKKVAFKDLAGTGGSPNEKILSYLLREIPGLERVIHAPRLNTAGASSKERIMMLDNSPEVVQAVLAQDFEQFAPQQDGLAFRVMCHARWGDFKLHQPKGIVWADGTEA
jgi:hypothetical protein